MKPRDNPDYVRFQNDKKQKEYTKRHKVQKIRHDIKYYKDTIARYDRWLNEYKERLKKARIELSNLGEKDE